MPHLRAPIQRIGRRHPAASIWRMMLRAYSSRSATSRMNRCIRWRVSGAMPSTDIAWVTPIVRHLSQSCRYPVSPKLPRCTVFWHRCRTISASTFGDAVTRCRYAIVSPYLLHHIKRNPQVKSGDPIARQSLSRGFMELRKLTGRQWENPPTFHEIRSLSGRLYNDSIDTQALLGHTDQKTTALYLDNKGTKWISVSKNSG